MINNGEIFFHLGNVRITRGASERIAQVDAIIALEKHKSGDWGELCKADKRMNNDAVKYGGRIVSSYKSFSGVEFWVITEADRNVTTILLPEEY